MSLAANLPYDHPYAGGYPGIGSQPLPTDADALDYLSRVKAADGAGVEVGVATAVSAFFRDTKAAGVFSALKACCILAGARTITGALVPLAGDAPTSNGFVSGDYSRTDGITGDGTSYIDSGRANDADPLNDNHIAAYCSSGTVTAGEYLIGAAESATPSYSLAGYRTYSRSSSAEGAFGGGAGLYAVSRSSDSGYSFTQASGSVTFVGKASVDITLSQNYMVFGYLDPSGAPAGIADDGIAFYSVGTGVGGSGLAALGTAVNNLLTAIGEAL